MIGAGRLVGGGADAARRRARLWLDKHHPGKHAWTLALMVVGLAIGCANAWYWVTQQDKAMRDEPEDGDE